MLIIFAAIAAFAAIGVYLTERVDRPRRRQARLAQSNAR